MNIRMPAVAGRFYPRDSLELDAMLDRFFAESACGVASSDSAKSARALIVPHAGYVYSGATAARTFASAKSGEYKRALVIAPSHRIPFSGMALCDYEAYSTPFGDSLVDGAAVDSLRGENGFALYDAAHDGEHALEVQLPFITALFPDLPIVPLICGGLDAILAENVSGVLSRFWNDETLWVISSDFTHYGGAFDYLPFTDRIPERLRKLDMGAVERILDFDSAGFAAYVKQTGATICGASPIRILLDTIAKSPKSANLKAELVELTNSGESTGDYSHCVSYAGIVIREAC
ncbi:MAG: AmmeMemoRadiSam system protein B [Kiritimatiellaeota bacterium]|nr:AmmeMemoRadiSam system protein B [Kiritimatiellota bacterium]